ncbi:flagellar export apparatus, transmembrane gate complex, FlhA component [Campylobacter sp. RM5004]|uniref:flagellar biosynthesis protein FlhA n=1 Tax=Campylobacter sp. RM5004 TaxID=1660078 RepID=UPI001EFC1C0D|nr:flagellar biosynthesis protein FlhA [Campylobacter sp. RM5004]ULO01093.1 flagellar export apparatus, transmembrane gate complex, FlhA component [Campylobacter sp. RM5004]
MAGQTKSIGELVAPYLAPVLKFKSLTMVFLIVAILAIIIVPLPSGILDFCLALSIAISVLMILISMYIPKPTDLTTFPTLILVITLFRLSLNIATTRMILSKGHEGPAAVSDIIASFGEFVVGGNYVIGVVVFCILVLINFMVVTKGSTRVSEVQARFTLDAMPGKQMAIDADLNAGLITEEQARERRQEIIGEANFYGAMDGSSKFIKGDAVAGIIITIVNVVGGLMIGMFQHDMDISLAASYYTILTIGDGLVSQIPGLITSTATAIIITRASKEEKPFAEKSLEQLFGDAQTLFIVGFILFVFALVPGLPTLSLGFMAFVFSGLGYLMLKTKDENFLKTKTKPKTQAGQQAPTSAGATPSTPPKKSEAEIAAERKKKTEDSLKLEMLELQIGYSLLKIAENDLVDRIPTMRQTIAKNLGFLMQDIRITDNLQLQPNEYCFIIRGIPVAKNIIYPDKFLAIDNGFDETDELEGIEVIEPAFGSKAIWIDPSEKNKATMSGYVVAHPGAVICTHISELIKQNAAELLTLQEVHYLLEKLKATQSIVVDECLKVAPISLIQKVLRQLLKDQIPIKDMGSILEQIIVLAKVTQDEDIITDHVRVALNRVITNLYLDENGTLQFYAFSNKVNARLQEMLVTNKLGNITLAINMEQTHALYTALNDKVNEHYSMQSSAFVLLVESNVRRKIAEICMKYGLKQVVVLAFSEMANNTNFNNLGNIDADI